MAGFCQNAGKQTAPARIWDNGRACLLKCNNYALSLERENRPWYNFPCFLMAFLRQKT